MKAILIGLEVLGVYLLLELGADVWALVAVSGATHIERICVRPDDEGEVWLRLPQTDPQTLRNSLILKGNDGCGIRRMTRSGADEGRKA
jgi:hypothetical protein